MTTQDRHPPGQSATRVVAVVVTYNRRQLLELTLASLLNARALPAALIVVDNASDDGTEAFLASLRPPIPYEVVRAQMNTGGAGGFAMGISQALAHHHVDLLWLMDDDTEVHADTLTEALALWDSCQGGAKPAFIASTVQWPGGGLVPMNCPRTRMGASRSVVRRAAEEHARPIRSASFVSVFVDATAARSQALPVAAYFMWNDDFEYTARLARHRPALQSERSIVTHHTSRERAGLQWVGRRFFYEVRNKVWLVRCSSALALWEKGLYLGSSVRRWLLAVIKASDRGALIGAGVRGLCAGLWRKSEPTEHLLRMAGVDHPGRAHQLPRLPAGSPFSVLMPVYGGDDPQQFCAALASIDAVQSRRPAQIVLVQDGPVPEALAARLREANTASHIHVVPLPKVGLARALDRGLEACEHEIVARMDADDVSTSQRFAMQVPYIEEGYAVVGSDLEELDAAGEPAAYRPIPQEVSRLALTGLRSPFHHPTVVLRKSAVQAVGGYGEAEGMEDYWLWVRMLAAGYPGMNVPQALLQYRASAAYRRRGGWKRLRQEWWLQGALLHAGFIGPGHWLRNLCVRGGYRLVPSPVRRQGFQTVFTRRSGPHAGRNGAP